MRLILLDLLSRRAELYPPDALKPAIQRLDESLRTQLADLIRVSDKVRNAPVSNSYQFARAQRLQEELSDRLSGTFMWSIASMAALATAVLAAGPSGIVVGPDPWEAGAGLVLYGLAILVAVTIPWVLIFLVVLLPERIRGTEERTSYAMLVVYLAALIGYWVIAFSISPFGAGIWWDRAIAFLRASLLTGVACHVAFWLAALPSDSIGKRVAKALYPIDSVSQIFWKLVQYLWSLERFEVAAREVQKKSEERGIKWEEWGIKPVASWTRTERQKGLDCLEEVAQAFEQRLPKYLDPKDTTTATSYRQSCRKIAAGIREWKRPLLYPEHNARDTHQRHVALLLDQVGADTWNKLPRGKVPTLTPRQWWYAVAPRVRALLVGLVPPAAVWLLQVLERPIPEWLAAAAPLFALAGILYAIDPGVAKKIAESLPNFGGKSS